MLTLTYKIISCISIFFRLSYLLVPLYDRFCQTTGYGGTININTKRPLPLDQSNLKKIKIDFQSQSQTQSNIEFYPTLKDITTVLGKPTLRFYTIKNLTNETIHGVRTYNVTPRKTAPYFHKLECFCFDEQRIKRNEIIELPILFYIDSNLLKEIDDIEQISINYTFYCI